MTTTNKKTYTGLANLSSLELQNYTKLNIPSDQAQPTATPASPVVDTPATATTNPIAEVASQVNKLSNKLLDTLDINNPAKAPAIPSYDTTPELEKARVNKALKEGAEWADWAKRIVKNSTSVQVLRQGYDNLTQPDETRPFNDGLEIEKEINNLQANPAQLEFVDRNGNKHFLDLERYGEKLRSATGKDQFALRLQEAKEEQESEMAAEARWGNGIGGALYGAIADPLNYVLAVGGARAAISVAGKTSSLIANPTLGKATGLLAGGATGGGFFALTNEAIADYTDKEITDADRILSVALDTMFGMVDANMVKRGGMAYERAYADFNKQIAEMDQRVAEAVNVDIGLENGIAGATRQAQADAIQAQADAALEAQKAQVKQGFDLAIEKFNKYEPEMDATTPTAVDNMFADAEFVDEDLARDLEQLIYTRQDFMTSGQITDINAAQTEADTVLREMVERTTIIGNPAKEVEFFKNADSVIDEVLSRVKGITPEDSLRVKNAVKQSLFDNMDRVRHARTVKTTDEVIEEYSTALNPSLRGFSAVNVFEATAKEDEAIDQLISLGIEQAPAGILDGKLDEAILSGDNPNTALMDEFVKSDWDGSFKDYLEEVSGLEIGTGIDHTKEAVEWLNSAEVINSKAYIGQQKVKFDNNLDKAIYALTSGDPVNRKTALDILKTEYPLAFRNEPDLEKTLLDPIGIAMSAIGRATPKSKKALVLPEDFSGLRAQLEAKNVNNDLEIEATALTESGDFAGYFNKKGDNITADLLINRPAVMATEYLLTNQLEIISDALRRTAQGRDRFVKVELEARLKALDNLEKGIATGKKNRALTKSEKSIDFNLERAKIANQRAIFEMAPATLVNYFKMTTQRIKEIRKTLPELNAPSVAQIRSAQVKNSVDDLMDPLSNSSYDEVLAKSFDFNDAFPANPEETLVKSSLRQIVDKGRLKIINANKKSLIAAGLVVSATGASAGGFEDVKTKEDPNEMPGLAKWLSIGGAVALTIGALVVSPKLAKIANNSRKGYVRGASEVASSAIKTVVDPSKQLRIAQLINLNPALLPLRDLLTGRAGTKSGIDVFKSLDVERYHRTIDRDYKEAFNAWNKSQGRGFFKTGLDRIKYDADFREAIYLHKAGVAKSTDANVIKFADNLAKQEQRILDELTDLVNDLYVGKGMDVKDSSFNEFFQFNETSNLWELTFKPEGDYVHLSYDFSKLTDLRIKLRESGLSVDEADEAIVKALETSLRTGPDAPPANAPQEKKDLFDRFVKSASKAKYKMMKAMETDANLAQGSHLDLNQIENRLRAADTSFTDEDFELIRQTFGRGKGQASGSNPAKKRLPWNLASSYTDPKTGIQIRFSDLHNTDILSTSQSYFNTLTGLTALAKFAKVNDNGLICTKENFFSKMKEEIVKSGGIGRDDAIGIIDGTQYHLSGIELSTELTANANKFINVLKNSALLQVIGRFVFAQLPELATIMGNYGVLRTVKSGLGLRGNKVYLEQLRQELGVINNTIQFRTANRNESLGTFVKHLTSASELERANRASTFDVVGKKLSDAIDNISQLGLNQMTDLSQALEISALNQAMLDLFRSGNRSKAVIGHWKNFGLQDDMVDRVIGLFKHTEHTNSGTLKNVDLNAMRAEDPVAFEAYQALAHRKGIAAKSGLLFGQVPLWAQANAVGRLSFQLVSAALAGQLNYLSQLSLKSGASLAYTGVLFSSLAGMAAFVVNTLTSNLSEEEKERRLQPETIMMQGFVRSSYGGLTQNYVSFGSSIAGYNDPTAVSRTRGDKGGLFALQATNNVIKAMSSLKDVASGEGLTQEQAHNFLRIFGLNLLVMPRLTQMVFEAMEMPTNKEKAQANQ